MRYAVAAGVRWERVLRRPVRSPESVSILVIMALSTLSEDKRGIGDAGSGMLHRILTAELHTYCRSHMQQDSILAVLGLLLAVALLGTNLFITHILARTIPLALGLGCAVYLLARLWPNDREPASYLLAYPQIGLVVFLFGTALLVLVAVLTGGRTTPFYVIGSLLGSFLLLQLFFTPDRHLHVGSIFVQILLLTAVLRFPALYTVPGFTGIDIWLHVPEFADGILTTGTVEGIGESKYVGSPLYHLLVVVTALFADVSLRGGLYLSLGIAVALSTLLLYSVSRVFLSPRWSLFVAATYTMADYFVRWSIHLVPTSMSIVLFFGVLFFFVRRMEAAATLRDDVLLIFVFLMLALTHQLSSFIVLTILGVVVVAHVVYTSSLFPLTTASDLRTSPVNITTTTLMSYFVFKMGLLSFVWSQTPYYGNTLLDGAVVTLQEDIATITDGGGGSENVETDTDIEGTPYQTFVSYLDWLGYLLLLFGTAVGTMVVMQAKRLTNTGFVFVVVVGGLTGIALVPPILGIDSLIPGRWYPFLYIGMAVLAAVGFSYLRADLAVPTFVACALVFALVYPGAMIFATPATPDNPHFSEDMVKYSYSESELVAAETITERTTMDGGGPLFSDHPYVFVLNQLGDVRFGVATLDEDGDVTNERYVYRNYQSTGAPQFNVDGDHRISQVSSEQACDPSKHQAYSNGDVVLCQE